MMDEKTERDVLMQLARYEGDIKTLFEQQRQMTGMVESVNKLSTSVQVMAESLKQTNGKVDGLVKDMEELKEKPTKRWESVVTGIIGAVVGAVMAYLFKQP